MFPTTSQAGAATTFHDGPPEAFWEKYNRRLELPLSTVAAILLHVLIGAVIVFGIFRLMSTGPDRTSVALQPADIVGFDDGGQGAPNLGGEPEPVIRRNDGGVTAQSGVPVEPTPLPEIKDVIRTRIEVIDPEGKMPISDSRAKEYADLHKSLLDKFLGAPQGAGPGDRPGGAGADSTLGRNLRWVLRFKVQGGRDYVEQLRSMSAVIVFPRPEDGSRLVYFSLGNSVPGAPRDGDLAHDAFQSVLAGKIRFSDARHNAVEGVAGAVGLDFTPRTFWAFFPKELEDKLARLETGYRNKRSDDIEETIFRVTMRGGSYDVIVDEQRMKR